MMATHIGPVGMGIDVFYIRSYPLGDPDIRNPP